MKRILIIIAGLLLIVSYKKVKASEIEITYSDWSVFYPSGLDERFIESETRYKWFKFENNEVVYSDTYSTSMDGYIKDEGSERTFYRYITNKVLLIDSKNNKVTDSEYCKKNFCYELVFTEPTMVNSANKTELKYDTVDIYEYTPEVTPYTGDKVKYSFLGLIVSILLLNTLIIKKKKMSNE